MRVVNTSVRKKDAMQLVTGQPVYVDDLAPQDCLIVKLLRSPYANAMVKTINTAFIKEFFCANAASSPRRISGSDRISASRYGEGS